MMDEGYKQMEISITPKIPRSKVVPIVTVVA